jgi:hypothetical protein
MDTQPTPPPPAFQAPPPAPAPLERPGMVTTAAIVMIVLGVLIVLFGLLFMLAGAVFTGAQGTPELEGAGIPPGMAGVAGGFLIGIAVIVLAIGILDIVAGAQVLSGKGWARITGIVLAVVLALFGLLGLFGGGDPSGLIVSVILIAANVFIVWGLASGGRWFAARAA